MRYFVLVTFLRSFARSCKSKLLRDTRSLRSKECCTPLYNFSCTTILRKSTLRNSQGMLLLTGAVQVVAAVTADRQPLAKVHRTFSHRCTIFLSVLCLQEKIRLLKTRCVLMCAEDEKTLYRLYIILTLRTTFVRVLETANTLRCLLRLRSD